MNAETLKTYEYPMGSETGIDSMNRYIRAAIAAKPHVQSERGGYIKVG